MKKILFFYLITLFTCISCKNKVDENQVDIRGKYCYVKNSEKLFTGDVVRHNANGTMSYILHYENGLLEGQGCWYDDQTGSKRVERVYAQGEITGPERIYNGQGVLVQETSFLNGHKHGIEKIYDDQGRLLEVIKYNLGKNIK